LQEDNGNWSTGRILAILTVVVGLGIAAGMVFAGRLTSSGVQLSLGLVGLGIAGKTVSKKLEG